MGLKEEITCKQGCDILSASGIRAHLTSKNVDISVFDEIDSTSSEAKRRTADGFCSYAIIAANGQTAGRGRQGKSFYSPKSRGLYFSIILNPEISLSDATGVTAATAVAVCEVLEEATKKDPKIKWVNDIFIDGKKVCGILTEAVTDFDPMQVKAVIIGIGINLTTEDFPDEIKEIATSVGMPLDRCKIIAEIFEKVKSLCDRLPDRSFMSKYREKSLVIERKISFERNGEKRTALVTDILDDGRLEITIGGKKEYLHSGEISIRL